MVDLFQDDWLSNLIGLCSIPEHKKKKINQLICLWMTASSAHGLSSFRGEHPFDPVRNQPLSASTETMLTARQKCALKNKTPFLPLWLLFSLELIFHLPAPKYC